MIDQWDYYDAYSEWLMANAEVGICNGHDLIRHLEAGTRFYEFLANREKNDGPGLLGTDSTTGGV